MNKLPLFLLLLSLAAATAAADVTSACPALDEPPADSCTASAYGLVYGSSRRDIETGARALESAAGQFRMYFGMEPPPGMLVLSRNYTSEAARTLAAAHSLAYGISWLPASASPGARPDTGASRRPGGARRDRGLHEDTLRHELGHAMHGAAFWPGLVSDTPIYGSPGPDWLDESVALLMEMPESQQQRGARFFAMYRSSPDAVAPLSTFLTMQHPALALQEMMRRRGQASASGVVSMELAPGDPTTLALDMFYGQSLVFAAFLVDASGEVRVLREVSEAAAAGILFERWLAGRGEASRLPPTLPLLQARWDEWLERISAGKGREPSG